jgi:glyoxylase-like metal-dependent hydrolase (beta-lactamase superfamily II)
MVERVVVGPWKTNCYIYSSTKKECIIIDPGGSEAEIASRVDVLNMVPVGIALTHGHVDHLAALGKLKDSYAARGYKLPIAINPSDRRFLGTGGRETHRENLEFLGLDEMSFFGVDADELPRADVRLKEGDRVFDMDLVVLETPGHTPGSVCLYAEKEGILFSGDTLFFDGVGRSDLPGGSEKKLRESIQKKIAVLPPETRVFPGHGPFTTVEREKRGNVYFRGMMQEVRPVVVQRPLMRPTAVPQKSGAAVPRPLAGAKGISAGAKRSAAGAKPPRAGAKRAAAGPKRAIRPGSAVKKSRPAGKTTAAKQSKRGARPFVRRPSAAAKKAKKRPPASARAVSKRVARILRSAPAARRSKGPAQRKRDVVVKKRPAAHPTRRKSAQATRSTKAPGAGRKPAR